jgi:two-component system sensor histidine kinase ChvG
VLERRAHDAKALAADISHELKNPLAAIRGATELLADGAHADPAARDRFLAMILDDVARLDRIVSRLLELARIEDDRALMAPVDLAAVTREIGERPWGAPVEVTCAPAIITGRGHAIAAAVENLVANAVQHAAPGTAVRVTVARTARAARIAVENHGPALSEAAQRRIWDRFYSTRVASGGSGLGLSIVRAVATAHRGQAGVSCAGGVTAFWIELAA